MQCPKALFLKKYHPELEDEVSEAQQAIFDMGHNVGDLAKQLFPGGTDLDEFIPGQIGMVFSRTAELVKQKQIIYEAGFSYDDNLCFSDILVPSGDKWKVYEVKGSTEVKDVYLWDAAFQYYLITQSGLEVEDISIIHINNQYVRHGEIDVQQLFTIESVKENVMWMQEDVKNNLKGLKKMLSEGKMPNVDIGPQCTDPYPCSFMGHCWQHVPDYSVFNITRLKADKKFELYRQGILDMKDVPEDYHLSYSQQLQVESEKSGQGVIDKNAVRAFLGTLTYPLAYLDFETINPAIPLFDNSKPYQQIPFQYSLHIQQRPGGALEHKEFLAKTDGDPRIPFIEQLIADLKGTADIVVYNKAFEETRLREIARDFPAYAPAIEQILTRIVDLMVIFSSKDYYVPEMKGSYSIKKVLPALVPGFGYDGLDIADGGTASNAFAGLYYEKDRDRIAKVRADLLKYCKLDTLAMVKIIDVLEKI
jgi:hypothetical protein